MRITILTTGSRGDVQPMIALGGGLARAGHRVRLATDPLFAESITAYGLEFFPMRCNIQQAGTILEQGQGGSRLRFAQAAVQGLLTLMAELNDNAWAACQGSEAIVYHPGVIGAHYMAAKLGVPSFPAYLQPFFPTSVFPSPLLGGNPRLRLPGALNRMTHHLMNQIFWQLARRAVGRWGSRQGMQAAFWGPFKQQRRRRIPLLHAYSPHVVPPPADWPRRLHVTGYWFLDNPADWQPPPALHEFLAAGPPPLYIGFGSMPNAQAAATTRLVLEAVARSGQRAILATGEGALDLTGQVAPKDVLVVQAAPHDWLFPQMSGVVHHGGAGSTAAGLRAGKPTLVVPFLGTEQLYWGRRVEALGAGPPPIPVGKLAAGELSVQLRTLATDQGMHRRAAALGEVIRREDGVSAAVALIEWISQRHANSRPKSL
jgi:sterol 3beta-glucosyltransferase